MRVPLIPMPTVWHVGTLEAGRRGERHAVSYEGAGLSVSNCPDAWRAMASLDGPTLRLDRTGALWLDLASLDDLRGTIVAHAVEAGLAEEREVWRAWIWEDGRDEWHSRPFGTEAEAGRFVVGTSDTAVWPRPGTLGAHLANLPDAALPPPCPALVEHVRIPLLTEAGDRRALGFGRMVDATDILAAFWAEDVLREAEPDVVGTWWRSRLDVGADLAPRGAVLPCAVREFAAVLVTGSPDLVPEPATAWRDVPLHGWAWSGRGI